MYYSTMYYTYVYEKGWTYHLHMHFEINEQVSWYLRHFQENSKSVLINFKPTRWRRDQIIANNCIFSSHSKYELAIVREKVLTLLLKRCLYADIVDKRTHRTNEQMTQIGCKGLRTRS